MKKHEILSASSFIATASMESLENMGWDFSSDYNDLHTPTRPQEEWKNDCNVQVIFRDGKSIYVVQEYKNGKWSDWAELSTGDDEKTAEDFEKLLEKGAATIEDYEA